jgi:hypothetical protein
LAITQNFKLGEIESIAFDAFAHVEVVNPARVEIEMAEYGLHVQQLVNFRLRYSIHH